MLRTVIKHAGSDESTREVKGEHEPQGECFSSLLECSRHFLSALLLYGAREKLFYLFYNIDKLLHIHFVDATYLQVAVVCFAIGCKNNVNASEAESSVNLRSGFSKHDLQ